MNTPSHMIITAALRKAVPSWKMPASAVLLGSVAPDIPLFLLSFGAFGYFTGMQDWSAAEAAEHMYSNLFYEDPAWITAHNFLHSPLLLVVFLAALQLAGTRQEATVRWLRWFVGACLLHSVIDVFTHNDDGPLVLWPLDWAWRFSSPISYWDPDHFGREFTVFEGVFDLVLLAYLAVPWLIRRWTAPPKPDEAET